MSADPEETPAEEYERLRREIAQLTRLRADLPRLILRPYALDAIEHIREVAAKLTVPAPGLPGVIDQAFLDAMKEHFGQKVSEHPEAAIYDLNGDGVVELSDFQLASQIMTTGLGRPVEIPELAEQGVVISSTVTAHSPEKRELVVLTRSGRIVTVDAEKVRPAGGAAPGPVAAAAPAPTLKPGQHVRDKTTGETGYIAEVADDKAQVALDRGGFVTRALGELESA